MAALSNEPPSSRRSSGGTASKLRILADAAKYDASCSSSGSRRSAAPDGLGNTEGMGICHSYTPDGRCVSLLKILLTNYCIYDCLYCINRISSDTERARFTVDEVVQLTLDFYRRNYIEGLFLSSGIIQSPDYTMEQLVAVARALRVEHRFGGYIHLKTIPGAAPELIREAGRWADRLSVNIELPTQPDLDKLAPAKRHETIERSMDQIHSGVEEGKESKGREPFAPAGQTTQMIVGATDASDASILQTSKRLYAGHGLRRVYYSAFSPIPHTAPGVPSERTPLVREHRLYQADWLYRFYGFEIDELTTADAPNLSLELDPKLAWALRNRHFFPLDLNRAPRDALLRVPGLGVRTVDKIIQARRFHSLSLADLLRLRVPFLRVKYFVIASDYHPDARLLDSNKLERRVKPRAEQLSLFAPPSVEQSDGLELLTPGVHARPSAADGIFSAGAAALHGEF